MGMAEVEDVMMMMCHCHSATPSMTFLDGGVEDSNWFGEVADFNGSWLRGRVDCADSWLGHGVD